MVSSSQLDMHRGRKRCLAQQKQNQLDRDYPNSCPKCAIALDPHNGENRRRHIGSCKPPAPAKKRKAPALVGGVSSKSQALMAGFFKRPAPPPAAAAAPAPAAAPTPTPEPPALDGDFHDEAFGGIPDFADNSEFVSPGAAGLLETVDVDMAGGVGAPDAGSVATAGTPVDAAPAGTPVGDSALTVQDHVTHASRQTGPTPTATRAPRLHLHTLVASATNATVKFCSGYSPPDALGGERLLPADSLDEVHARRATVHDMRSQVARARVCTTELRASRWRS